MVKRYSVSRNRWYMKMLINEPYFYEREDDTAVHYSPRMRNAMLYTALIAGLVGGMTR